MSFVLFKATCKRNWLLFVIFFCVLAMYLSVMISMFDPANMDELKLMLDMLPDEIVTAFGFGSAITDITSYLASWLYGIMMFGFPLAYSIMLGSRLVAKTVDDGSFAYLHATPNSRLKIITTQGVYALSAIALMFVLSFAAGVIACELAFPGLLDIPAFLLLNAVTALVNMTAIMICFFFSCLFNDAKYAVGFGAGVTVALLLMYMLGGAANGAKFIKDASIYGLYDPVELVNGGSIGWQVLFYICVIAVLFALSLLVFRRKRLPL